MPMVISPNPRLTSSVISQVTFIVFATHPFYIECVQDLGSSRHPLRYTFTTGTFERLHKHSGFLKRVVYFGASTIHIRDNQSPQP
jgi:hypothetical protein